MEHNLTKFVYVCCSVQNQENGETETLAFCPNCNIDAVIHFIGVCNCAYLYIRYICLFTFDHWFVNFFLVQFYLLLKAKHKIMSFYTTKYLSKFCYVFISLLTVTLNVILNINISLNRFIKRGS